jgi:hypothetical protein
MKEEYPLTAFDGTGTLRLTPALKREEAPLPPLDLVSKYRKFHELHSRVYQDDEVRSCVFLILQSTLAERKRQ